MGDDEGEAVRVAVRMRMFNKREQEAGATRVVRMEKQQKGSNTYITNPATGEEKKFAYDFSFQSHSETEPGIGSFATQDTVFDELGRPVLMAALDGRDVCLFAYGQTGAGKSYSMLGKPDAPGIIPRTCGEIFHEISQNTDKSHEYTVDIQVVEIYCEVVNDLLSDRKKWPPAGHKPRLTDKGYVVDTLRMPCFSYDDIQHAFEFADRNRSVGSHALNSESSRAHTIYSINYERRKKHESGKIIETVSSKLNLVDLAGSERCESAGTTGQMLKEGNAINLSLTALGSCIKALSEKKKPNFRDSKLTLLLQGSMTNGQVVMIAAVSPASICFDESMSTLRFADRIKQVKIKARLNVTLDPVADMKRAMEEMRNAMQEEIDKLIHVADGSADPEELDALNKRLAEQAEENEALKREMEERQRQLDEDVAERCRRAAEIAAMQRTALGGCSMMKKEEVKDPFFLNLHQDPRLAETLVYPFKQGRTVIGRADKENPPGLEFNGMGMIKNHCTIDYDGQKVQITPNEKGKTMVNGHLINDILELRHNNRVWLGSNYAFRFMFPGHEERGEVFEEAPDYFFAEKEIAENSSFDSGTEFRDQLPPALAMKLSDAIKKVEQANVIANDLERGCKFEARLVKNRVTGENDIVVSVASLTQEEQVWPWDKFNARSVDFVTEWQAWQHAEETGEKFKPAAEDPFWDGDYQLIGEADVWLESLSNLMDHEADTSILAFTGQTEGKIKVSLQPLDKNGGVGPWEGDAAPCDPFVEDPRELLGKNIEFLVNIDSIRFENKARKTISKYEKVWVRYRVNYKDTTEEWSRTNEIRESSFNPRFGYSKKHLLQVTNDTLDLLVNERIIFQVWGKIDPEYGSAKATTSNDKDINDRLIMLEQLERQIEERNMLLRSLS